MISLGGAMAIVGIEMMGWAPADADARVAALIEEALGRVYDEAAADGITTAAAARRLAERWLAASDGASPAGAPFRSTAAPTA